MNKPRVFIATPTAHEKNYCYHEFVMNLSEIRDYYGHGKTFWAVSDNSLNQNEAKKHTVYGANYYGHIKRNDRRVHEYLADSHQDLLERFMKDAQDGDYFLHLESDIFPPIDIIDRLLSHNVDVVGAIYHIGESENSYLAISQMYDYPNVTTAFLKQKSIDLQFANGELKQVHSVGLGCVLFTKNALTDIKFRSVKGDMGHPDTHLMNDLIIKGITVYADTSTYCKHLNKNWKYNLDVYKK